MFDIVAKTGACCRTTREPRLARSRFRKQCCWSPDLSNQYLPLITLFHSKWSANRFNTNLANPYFKFNYCRSWSLYTSDLLVIDENWMDSVTNNTDKLRWLPEGWEFLSKRVLRMSKASELKNVRSLRILPPTADITLPKHSKPLCWAPWCWCWSSASFNLVTVHFGD